jgi:hypothetical protein
MGGAPGVLEIADRVLDQHRTDKTVEVIQLFYDTV